MVSIPQLASFRMRVFLLVALLFSVVTSDWILTSCARMDTPILQKMAQGECIVSCKTQNCGTGHCEDRGRPVCVCSRCDKGSGPFPGVDINIGKGRK